MRGVHLPPWRPHPPAHRLEHVVVAAVVAVDAMVGIASTLPGQAGGQASISATTWQARRPAPVDRLHHVPFGATMPPVDLFVKIHGLSPWPDHARPAAGARKAPSGGAGLQKPSPFVIASGSEATVPRLMAPHRLTPLALTGFGNPAGQAMGPVRGTTSFQKDVNLTATCVRALPVASGRLHRPVLALCRTHEPASISFTPTPAENRLQAGAGNRFPIRRLADDMLNTMYDAPGIGLAAPQWGNSSAFSSWIA